MSSQMIPVDPFDYVVFGATGDLTERKLLPALYHRQIAGQFTDPTRIIGASRSELTSEQFREHADKALKEHLKDGEYDSVVTWPVRLRSHVYAPCAFESNSCILVNILVISSGSQLSAQCAFSVAFFTLPLMLLWSLAMLRRS